MFSFQLISLSPIKLSNQLFFLLFKRKSEEEKSKESTSKLKGERKEIVDL